MQIVDSRESSSFRDPSGFVFWKDGILKRQINKSFESSFKQFRESGLENELVESQLLIPTKDDPVEKLPDQAFCILIPERIPFISYPYEWSFSQLKDAALLTLTIQEKALAKGFCLKDASAFNVQFLRGKPIFIDSLSFEPYSEGTPWIGYRQFCRHFLAPLALMAIVDVRLGSLLSSHIDGIPLDLASRILQTSTKFKPGILMHLHAHAKSESHSAGETKKTAHISKTGILALIDSLKSTVESLKWNPSGTEWGDYYQETNYSPDSMSQKEKLVAQFVQQLSAKVNNCWDLGANTGEFSRIAASEGLDTVSWDIDPAAVEKNYLSAKKSGETNILPLLQDLTNPSSSLGWSSSERSGLIARGPADLVLALALIHHLAIGNNVPLAMVARFFKEAGKFLILEFVPKEDSQVKRMLANREDIFPTYSLDGWLAASSDCFEVLDQKPIEGTERTLLLMKALA